jgi:hypothetical protein
MWFRRLILSCTLTLGDAAIAQTVIVEEAWPNSSSTDAMMAAYRDKTLVVRPCDRSGDSIVVCGNRAERSARERLPLPRETVESGPMRGELQRASAARVKQGSCGVVGGQGTGCVGGGVPILGAAMLLSKAVQGLIDPDADLSSPPPLPDQFRGVVSRP